MAREIRTPHFGGREWPLRFTGPDGVEIKNLLGKKPRRVLDEDLLEIKNGLVFAADIDLHTLVTLVWLGIRHDPTDPSGRKPLLVDKQELTYDVVLDWMTEYMAASSLLPLAEQVREALLLSGVTGRPVDLEAARREAALKAASGKEETAEPEPSVEGKAQTTESTPSTATP